LFGVFNNYFWPTFHNLFFVSYLVYFNSYNWPKP
jgi:hypothetical protein